MNICDVINVVQTYCIFHLLAAAMDLGTGALCIRAYQKCFTLTNPVFPWLCFLSVLNDLIIPVNDAKMGFNIDFTG